MCQTNTAGCNGKGSAERELPDEQKRDEPAEFLRTVNFIQITIGSAGPGHSRTQLRPNQAIAHCKHRAHHPAQHGLRTAHCAHDERDRNKRTHPNHVDHVKCGRTSQPHAPNQLRRAAALLGLFGDIHELVLLMDFSKRYPFT